MLTLSFARLAVLLVASLTQTVHVENQSSCDVRVVVMQGSERIKSIPVTSLSKRATSVRLPRTGVPARYVVEPGAGCSFDRYAIDAELVDAPTVAVTVGATALTSTARPRQ